MLKALEDGSDESSGTNVDEVNDQRRDVQDAEMDALNEDTQVGGIEEIKEAGDTTSKKYKHRLEACTSDSSNKREAVILSISGGVGSATVALKQLGFKMKRVIHVEKDRVAQHAYRSNHDMHYGEASGNDDDGIEHVVGLYEGLDDLMYDPKSLVETHGPIDMIICHFCLNDQIIEFFGEVEAHNKSIHGLRHLFHLSIGDRDTFPIQYSRRVTSCKFKAAHTDNTYFCNWLLPPNNESLRELDIPYSSGSADTPTSELKEISMGFPSKYVQESVSTIYQCLKKGYLAGFDQKFWRDEVHPKFWNIGNGPSYYDITSVPGMFGQFLLYLKKPSTEETISEKAYSKYLLESSISIRHLRFLLRPLKELFHHKTYGDKWEITSLALPVNHDNSSSTNSATERQAVSHQEEAFDAARPVKQETSNEPMCVKNEDYGDTDDGSSS